MINIKGMNKAAVLKALYDRSHVQGMGFLQAVPEGFVTEEHCAELLECCTYFDYLYGRVLKVDLSGDEFDERLYDRDNGAGAAARAVNSVNKSECEQGGFIIPVDGLRFDYAHEDRSIKVRVADVKSLERLIFVASDLLEKMKGGSE